MIEAFLSAACKCFTISILYSFKSSSSLFSVSNDKLLKPVKNSKASIGVPPIIFAYPPFTLAQAFSNKDIHISFFVDLAYINCFVSLSTGR